MEVQTLLIPQLSQLDDSEKKYLVTRGGQQIQWYPFTAQSHSSSNISFKCDPPSPNTVVGRNLIIATEFEATFVGTPLGSVSAARLLNENEFALRAYPFSSVVNTVTANINGQSITSQLGDFVHILSRFNDTAESRTSFGSITPSALDTYQSYAAGTSNSPLQGYDGAKPGTHMPRGAYPLTITGNSTSSTDTTEKTVVVRGKIYEYVSLSPFYSKSQEGCGGLSNISNLSISFTMSELSHMFSMPVDKVAAPGGVPSITSTVKFLDTPTMYLEFISPPVDMVIPRSLNFAYNDYSYYSHRGSTILAGASDVVTSPVIQWSQLPEKVYICVRRPRSESSNGGYKALSTTDTYFGINSINVNFGNQDGILAAAKPSALYLQAVRNGCNLSFVEWSGQTTKFAATNDSTSLGTVGSVIALEMGKDIPLQGLDAPGMSGSWNMQVTVNAKNVSAETLQAELCIVAVFDGIVTIEHPGRCYVTLGMVTPEQILQASNSEESYDDVMRLYGGSFGSNIKRFFKNNAPMLRQLGKTVGMVVAPELTKSLDGIIDRGQNIVASAQQDARNLTAAQQGSALQGGLRAGMRAGALQGGQVIPKSTLRSRAR